MNALRAQNAFFFEKHILFGKKGTVVQETNHKISRPFCFALLTIAIKTTKKCQQHLPSHLKRTVGQTMQAHSR